MTVSALVLGSTGMLGHMVARYLGALPGFRVAGTRLAPESDPLAFNAEHGLAQLARICDQEHFDYFINCIGILAQKVRPDEPAGMLRALRVNSLFPQELALFAAARGVRVVHISTDGVFSGGAAQYDELDVCDCPDAYGKTKCLGEAQAATFLNIRCSIFGPSPHEGGGLYEWLRAQPANAEISGYTDNIWKGVSTLQFARLCARLMQNGTFDRMRALSHLFHFAPNQAVSKYELLCLAQRILQKNLGVKPCTGPAGACRRILVSRYQPFRDLFEQDIPMERMLIELQNFVNSSA